MSRKVFQDLQSSFNRDMGKGECVDCWGFSGKYIRCYKCNQGFQKRKTEKKQKLQETDTKRKLLMIERGNNCMQNGGNCGNIICPNCSPMDCYDEELKEFCTETLEYLMSKYA